MKGAVILKIAVFSDTHGSVNDMLALIEELKPNHVIHLGDYVKDAYEIEDCFPAIGLSYVAGNNDYFSGEPFCKTEFIAGKCFYLLHGHQYESSARVYRIIQDAKEIHADFALFGHTHKPYSSYEYGVYVMNPGSISRPRSSQKSYGLIEISGDNIRTDIFSLSK